MDEAQVDANKEGPVDETENHPDFLLSPNHNDGWKDDYDAVGVEVLNKIKLKFLETTDPSEIILPLILHLNHGAVGI